MLRTRSICRDERQIERGLGCRRKLALGAFRSFLQTLKCQPILSQVNSCILEKLICHPIHNPFVEIFAAQIRVARSRKHLKDAVVHFEN